MKLSPVSQYWILAGLLLGMSIAALGYPGIILSFWILLFWYSVWQRPCRFEMLFLSVVGLAGGIAILPRSLWEEINGLLLLLMLVVAFLPLYKNRIPYLRDRV